MVRRFLVWPRVAFQRVCSRREDYCRLCVVANGAAMTFIDAMFLEAPAGKKRSLAAAWACIASGLCSILLGHSILQTSAHRSEIAKIVNYSTDGVIVCDQNGQVIFTNDAARAITGFSERELVESGLAQIIPDALQEKHRQGIARARDKSARGIEGVFYRNLYPVTRKDGKTIVCLVSVGSVLHFGGPQFFAYITPIGEVPERKESAKPGSLSAAPPTNLD